MQMPYMPHEVVVSHILPRLPARTLLRFRRVCKAWHDASFHRAHLRLHSLAQLLIVPRIQTKDHRGYNMCDRQVITAGLYRLEESQQNAATLVLDMSGRRSFPLGKDGVHVLTHCDGLLLLSAGDKVRVLNPATRRFLTLPWSTNAVRPAGFPGHLCGHQAFGLGRDPGSNTYKVARFFHRSEGGYYQYDVGMEVFTIGTEHRWRETTAQLLYPVMLWRTATFFKGSLIWTIEELFHGVTPGFLRFNLEDESFSVMPPPPCQNPVLDYKASSLAELRGELCMCVPPRSRKNYGSIEIWTYNDLDNCVHTQWERRYILTNVPRSLRLVGMFDEQIVFQAETYHLWVFKQAPDAFKNVISIEDLKFRNPENGTVVEYQRRFLHGCDAITYVPSLVPL